MNIDLIYNFWSSRFEIIEDKLPIQECTQKLLLFCYSNMTFLILTSTMYSFSRNSRGFPFTSSAEGNAAFYNERRVHPNTTISLTLVNSKGLINQSDNKCDFLHSLITNLPAGHIIAMTETHLTTNHGDGEITKSFEKFTVHRSDRNTNIGRKTKWGGVLLLTSPGILSTKGEEPYSNGCCELLINELNELSITILCIYRPPDATLDEFKDVLERSRNDLNSNTKMSSY